jgi:hypothetical protein
MSTMNHFNKTLQIQKDSCSCDAMTSGQLIRPHLQCRWLQLLSARAFTSCSVEPWYPNPVSINHPTNISTHGINGRKCEHSKYEEHSYQIDLIKAKHHRSPSFTRFTLAVHGTPASVHPSSRKPRRHRA